MSRMKILYWAYIKYPDFHNILDNNRGLEVNLITMGI